MSLAIIALLVSTPSMIFARSVGVVDTELRQAGSDAQTVLVKFDLGDKEVLKRFPTHLGDWRMEQEYEWDNIGEILNTDVLMSRDYQHPALFQPVNLLIVQSNNVSSFHPAPVCYRVQGWDVPTDGVTAKVAVENATWAEEQWLADGETRVFRGNLTAKVLEVTRGDEKRVALYVYLKREDWRVTNEVTWVRTEIAIPASANASDAIGVLADLLGETIPQLFSFQNQEETILAQAAVERFGWLGGFGVALAATAPAAGSIVLWRRSVKIDAEQALADEAADEPPEIRPSAPREGPK